MGASVSPSRGQRLPACNPSVRPGTAMWLAEVSTAHELISKHASCWVMAAKAQQDRISQPNRRHCLQNLYLRDPGIEPGSVPWQGTILPLNQPRFAWPIARFCHFCIIFHVQTASHLSLCMMQAATVVRPTVRSMVHAKVSLQGGSQPNLCTRKVAALRASIRRSSVRDQVSCLNHSARLHRRHVLVSSQCSQFCAVSHRIKLRLCPRAY